MPRGLKPKVYPLAMVERVKALYGSGLTQVEVAKVIGSSQKVVWNLMRRHQILRRRQVKRNQFGSNNSSWKGSDAGYAALHLRVQVARGKPSLCEYCGRHDQDTRYEWANLTGNYADVSDYARLCVSCHHRMDGHVCNIKHMRQRLEGPEC